MISDMNINIIIVVIIMA